MTRKVFVGNVPVGGGAEISIQSMTNTDTRNAEKTIEQILRLEAAGCEIIRVAVPDTEAATKLIISRPELFRDYEIIKGRMDDVFLSVTGKKLNGGND